MPEGNAWVSGVFARMYTVPRGTLPRTTPAPFTRAMFVSLELQLR